MIAGEVLDFEYTGEVQSIELAPGKYKLEVWGAQGGYRSGNTYGGKGGYSVGTITLNNYTTLYALVGGSGNTGGTNGGFNGGGVRHTYNGGGGATDFRVNENSLFSRVIVAGGGGSCGVATKAGGVGGGTSGLMPTTTSYGTNYSKQGLINGVQGGASYLATTPWTAANPTTQASTYSGFGFGGAGPFRSNGYGGAGGGGWYGGGGNYPDTSADDDAGGAGGSGWIYTEQNEQYVPTGWLLTSEFYLTDASTTAGNTSFTSPTGTSEVGHTGDGYARITCIELLLDLITDRTQEDVDRVKQLQNKGYNNFTQEELAEFAESLKGAYNVSDLNRVGKFVEYLSNRLEEIAYPISVSIKYDWVKDDIPTIEQLTTFLNNIRAIRNVFSVDASTPPVPEDMEWLTYDEANDIEQILLIVDSLVSNIIASFVYCGQPYSGMIWEEFTI